MVKIILAAVLLLLPGQMALASTVVRTGDAVTVSDNQTVTGNFYGIGGTVALSGVIDGDAAVMGGNVTVNGSVSDDLFAIGGNVSLNASMTEDVRIIAGDVTISEPVGGSVVVLAGRLTILSTATIGGDVLFYGGDATIDGAVIGKVLGTAERVRINNAVDGGVDITTPYLTLGDQASINGDVRYVSENELTRATGAVVTGEVSKSDVVTSAAPVRELRSVLVALLMSLFATFTLYLLFRRHVERIGEEASRQIGMKALVGFAVLFVMPIAIVILLVSVLGMFVGLVATCVFLLFVFLGLSLTSVVTGALVSGLVTKKRQVSVLWIAIGAIVVQVLLVIPVLGLLAVVALFLLTLGTVVVRAYQLVK